MENESVGVFDVAAGEVCNLWDVDMLTPLGLCRLPDFTATATNQIKFRDGKWRRLFIDASIEIVPGQRGVWLANTRLISRTRKERVHEKTQNQKNNTRPVNAGGNHAPAFDSE